MIKIIIFDWKRTLYDPDTKLLNPGALDLLEFLKGKNIPLILIGKGGEDMEEEVNRLRVRKYFQKTVFAEGDKDPDIFAPFILKDSPKETIFIGDRVRSELEIGNRLGATTVWVKQGKFADEEPEIENQKPDYKVSDLVECLELILSLI